LHGARLLRSAAALALFFKCYLKSIIMGDDPENIKLSFPQRYWLLLCILVAIFSPIAVQWLNAAANHVAYRQATETKPATAIPASNSTQAPTSDSSAK
jgi:hypothetical protein